MGETSAALSLPYIQPSQAQKHVTHNAALRILDAATQLSVLDGARVAPPAQPATGDRYLIASGATGDWAGKDGQIAVFDGTGWTCVMPKTGWRADIIPTGAQVRFDGAAWVAALPDLQNVPQIGVQATADATNRLVVASDATLFSHDGGGHQLKINKAADADTASLLFQSGWAARAEIGLSGSNNLSVKVSADGATFNDALVIDPASAALRIPSGQTYLADVTLDDDSAHSFDIPWSDPSRALIWMGVDLTGHSFLFSVTGPLVGAANFTPLFVAPAGVLDFASSALSGTTGPDDHLNVAIDTSGVTPRFYIENRLGATRQITLATLGR
jgi:uncharacterized protein DUF2793